MIRTWPAFLLTLVWLLSSDVAWANESPESFFREKVQPLLVGRCIECHGGDEPKGDLDLRSKISALKGGESGEAIVPGKPEESLLYDFISTDEMPPEKPLTAVEVDIFKRWITEGAYYPKKQLDLFDATTESRAGRDWWSFQPIKNSSPPASPTGRELKSPINRFIVASLQQKGLSLSPPADRATLIRRVSFDLTGLQPSNWDGHNDLEGNHRANAMMVDQPIAALLTDLKQRGMLEDTLVVWTGEFGRTPTAEGAKKGRDHNISGFTLWMAGGGMKPGMSYGSTDEIGFQAVDQPVEIADLHATILHTLGLDHQRLTYYYNGLQRRLTGVKGLVLKDILS